jgi:hypothetical protein
MKARQTQAKIRQPCSTHAHSTCDSMLAQPSLLLCVLNYTQCAVQGMGGPRPFSSETACHMARSHRSTPTEVYTLSPKDKAKECHSQGVSHGDTRESVTCASTQRRQQSNGQFYCHAHRCMYSDMAAAVTATFMVCCVIQRLSTNTGHIETNVLTPASVALAYRRLRPSLNHNSLLQICAAEQELPGKSGRARQHR